MLVQLGQSLLNRPLNRITLRLKAWHSRHQNTLKIVLVHQGTKEPEGGHLTTVVEQDSRDEVHTLNVAYRLVVVCKSRKNSPYTSDGAFLLEEVDFDESPLQVLIDIK